MKPLQKIPHEMSEDLRKMGYPFNQNKEGWILVPLQAEVIKWFRERKGLIITICYSILSYYYEIRWENPQNDYYTNSEDFETYEQAEYEGIKKAIKLCH